MRCYVEFISVPTADTPGTLLLLHFDNQRYLIGRLSEGSTRACAERAIGLRKVSDILLTGKTEWANVGGLLGMILGLADTKAAARAAALAPDRPREHAAQTKPPQKQPKASENDPPHINIFGAPNLNHLFATARRFIFRTGIPLNVQEFAATDQSNSIATADIAPTWKDSRIQVWAMPILPGSDLNKAATPALPSRKRTFEETTDDLPDIVQSASDGDADMLRQSIVKQMFDSSWRYDRLVSQPLLNVQGSTACFVQDPLTNKVTPYQGPMPGGDEPVPDITVLAREPWPGAATTHIPPTQPAAEALSYIIRNYPQRGKFMPQKAKQLGIPQGLNWSRLANGETIANSDGDLITPDMVLQPGKQGGGLAVVDLPSDDYVDPLLARPEWQSDKVMDGVEAIIWILGPKVLYNERLLRFRQEHPHMKHIISSQDCCPNVLALERAAKNALRHNIVDNDIFPKLQWDDTTSEVSYGRAARPGQVVTLEPKVEFEDDRISACFDPHSTSRKLLDDIQSSEAVASAMSLADKALEYRGQPRQLFGDVEIVVLGTGSSHPSTYRNVSGTLIRVPGWGSCLFDCGEGTLNTLQRMFSDQELAAVLMDLKIIWISHMHADHHLGLTSILKAWNKATSENFPLKKLSVVSSASMLHWIHEYSSVEELGMSRIIPLATTALDGRAESQKNSKFLEKQGTSLRFVNPRSLNDEDTRTTADIIDQLGVESLNTVFVNHCRGAQAVSIVFKSGFKISYSGDCRPNANFTLIGRGSHVLIHEATLEDDMRAEAIAKKHSTAGEALIVASEMQAQICLLTHFSQRYPTMPPLGVKVEKGSSQVQVQQLGGVLEDEQDDSQPDVGVPENGQQGHSVVESTPFAAAVQIHDHQLEVIDENDIQRLIDKTGLKVLFAFDYMRLKLKDVPRLELKQPVLRQICDLEIAKDGVQFAEVDQEMKDAADKKISARERKKQEKRDSLRAENNPSGARWKNRAGEITSVNGAAAAYSEPRNSDANTTADFA